MNLSHLSLTLAVRSPRTKIKQHQSNTLLPNRHTKAASHFIGGIERQEINLEDPLLALGEGGIASLGEDLSKTACAAATTEEKVSPKIKPSRSLKALKHSKRKNMSKDMKMSIDQMMNHHAPSSSIINIGGGGGGDMRLFSIYGVPPTNNPIFLKKNGKNGKSKKRREPSLILKD